MRKVFKETLIYCVQTIYTILYYVLKMDDKVIIFESNLGKNYSGNPKAIYEEMVRQGLDNEYKCIWVFNNPRIKIIGNHKKIKKLRLKYLFYTAKAKFWIVDTRQPNFLKKKQDAVFVQTWHGTPLKRLGFDMFSLNMGGDKDLEKYKKQFKESADRWDLLIAQNNYSRDIFKSAFKYNKNILVSGYPRNDKLFNLNEQSVKDVKINLGLPLDKKIILYAPTWRDNQYIKKGYYSFNTGLDFKKLKDALSDEYIFIIKTHYLVAENLNLANQNDFIYQFNHTQDITELYIVSDCLITDYSSVMFDFSVTKKPMIFYVHDYEEYRDQLRGFYFDLFSEAPGQVTRSTKEVINALEVIENDDLFITNSKYLEFTEKYNHMDDGKASERVINYLFS